MSGNFREELIKSGLIHRPLSDIWERSLEKERKKEKILGTRTIWKGDIRAELHHGGEGSLTVQEEQEPYFTLSGKTVTYCWPPEMSQDGDCAFYGTVCGVMSLEREDWQQYHRLRFKVRPRCDGSRILNITVALRNEGEVKVPDEYYREGSHVVELKNHQWNDCIWEFGSVARDVVTELGFYCRLNGRDTATGEYVIFDICDVVLESLEHPYRDKGWQCEPGKIAYPSTGYFRKGRKTAVTSRTEDVFYIVSDDTGVSVYSDVVKRVSFGGETFGVLDFTPVEQDGRYHIHMGDYRTEMFVITDGVCDEAAWKVLNFLFCERCGYPVPGKHGLCHMDMMARHGGRQLSFCGGWHDAGDLSQQMIHTAETVDALYRLAETVKEKDIVFYKRLMEEAAWGLEYVLRTRFGDGYRGTSAGLVRWTNGIQGDKDDIEARVHNHALENLMCSAICSQAAKALAEEDPELAFRCREVAAEDFAFGMERYREKGMELPIMWEHTYQSSKSQYAAVIVLAATGLYAATAKESYRDIAWEYVQYLLSCQETEGEIKGYFYRDEEKKAIVHFTHQSREYLFAQALTEYMAICEDKEQRAKVDACLRLYGAYLKKLMEYASPYGMFPAGVYRMDEAEDKETFELLHLLVNFEEQQEHYRQQILSGQPVGEELYVRQFPVWFSFRGNTAIHMAAGRAAGILGNYFRDETYREMAREQLYWLNGKNPFRQSLIYGDGLRYPGQYAVMAGEMVGEIPVGMETWEDEDIPYWPYANNATYKEVWTSSANRWLWVLTEVLKGEFHNA